jgi:hypothetical protein
VSRTRTRACVAEREGVPLSIPSAPSRIAASKLAMVFSGNREEAWKALSIHPSATLGILLTPRCPQQSSNSPD